MLPCESVNSDIAKGAGALTFPHCTTSMRVKSSAISCVGFCVKQKWPSCWEKMRDRLNYCRKKSLWFHTWLSPHLSCLSVRTDPFPPVCPVLSFCVCFVRLFFPGMGYRTLQASLSDGILSFTQGITFNLTVLTSSSRHTRNNDGESHGEHGH